MHVSRITRRTGRRRLRARGDFLDDARIPRTAGGAAFLPLFGFRRAEAATRSGDALGVARGVRHSEISSGGCRIDPSARTSSPPLSGPLHEREFRHFALDLADGYARPGRY